MKSDVIKVKNTGEGMTDALHAALDSAAYRRLEKKDALHLRLLAEETLGMMSQITSATDADFWVQSEGKQFEIHLVAFANVTVEMRKELLKSSTSGKNEAARGFMGMIRDIFDRALASQNMSETFEVGMALAPDIYSGDPMSYATNAGIATWTMSRYRTTLECDSTENAKEEWDELERSIVANIADEVKIAIEGDKVEMTVYKNFK